MNSFFRLRLVYLLVAIVYPMLVSGQKIKVDYDKSVEFAKLKTYSWGQLGPEYWPLLRLNIIGAIDEQLAAKGLVKTDNNADLIVTYSGDLIGEANRAVSAPASPTYSGPPPSSSSTVWTGSSGMGRGGMTPTYPKGTLVVDLLDSRSGKIAWRGVGSVKLDMEKKRESLVRLNDLIAKMFVRYPPQKTRR